MGTIQYNTIQYNTIQHNTTQYNTTQYNTIQYNTIQYNTTQHNTIQHNTIQYNTIQYYTEDDLSIKCKFLYYLNKMTMTIHLDCYATTDCKPEVLSGVETGNRIPHDE